MNELSQQIEQIRGLVYRSQFQKVLKEIDSVFLTRQDIHSQDTLKLALIKSQALFELNYPEKSKIVLETVARTTDEISVELLYVLGKVAYQNLEFKKAGHYFQQQLNESESLMYFFRAKLGLLLVYRDTNERALAEEVIEELEEMKNEAQVEESICYDLFFCAAYKFLGMNPENCLSKVMSAIKKAQQQNWIYYVTKGLYSMAILYRDMGQDQSLLSTLRLLSCYLDHDEMRWVSDHVESQFGFKIDVAKPKTICDHQTMRLQFLSTSADLSRSPKVFSFVTYLEEHGRFVDKESMAKHLWPNETYSPRSHDPRIFDIARRARDIINEHGDGYTTILSGRAGYKLIKSQKSSAGQIG